MQKMKEEPSLIRWLIRSIDGDAYRAGRLSGMKHPKVDQRMIDATGGMRLLIAQVEELEEAGLLKAEKRNLGADLVKLEYPVSIMPELCRRAGIEDPRKRQIRYIAKTQVWLKETEGTYLEPYYRSVLKRLEEGQDVRNPDMEDDAFFRCLNAIPTLEKPMWRHVFSASVLGDSKLFERQYETRVLTVLTDRSPLYVEGMTNTEVLSAHGILTYSQTLEWKGPLCYCLDGETVIDSSDCRYGTVINAQTLEHARPYALPSVKKVIVIENKANYEDMQYRDDTLFVYCHGFFSPKETEFLRKITDVAVPGIQYLHWGDMDLGGIRIFLYNRKQIFPELRPYRMNREEFERALSEGAGISLKKDKRENLEKMDAGELEDLKMCILETGKEIEQEVLIGV